VSSQGATLTGIWGVDSVLAMILIIVLAVLILRRIPTSGWRILICALLLAALFNPVLQREEHDRLPGTVALIIDESAKHAGHAGAKSGGGHFIVNIVNIVNRCFCRCSRSLIGYNKELDVDKAEWCLKRSTVWI